MNEKKLERGDKNAWHLWRISMAEQLNVDVIIKLGGCAVTDKRNFETVKYEAIDACAKVVKRINGKCIVVHGAGSFGHFQAHEYALTNGFSEDLQNSRIGFAKTRQSVTKLQQMVIESFISNGIPAVGISPCGSWMTTEGVVTRSAIHPIVQCVAAGFVPILHGDCVLDTKQGCAILSGDKIIEKLVEELHPGRVVFLTDVDGIYNKPPDNEGQ
ncbi:isopentenyl phosphate kinase-like isoform X1 [Acropora millepora]|uniref:isopentenyl phosphate kinase-like isoform X1 n=1 Tax=Acropora millepora TaxID=45264 RepID=UPI001CF5E093|nr:isopentenyl phosphate kinase-like isoform X1 [Acropora millepora]